MIKLACCQVAWWCAPRWPCMSREYSPGGTVWRCDHGGGRPCRKSGRDWGGERVRGRREAAGGGPASRCQSLFPGTSALFRLHLRNMKIPLSTRTINKLTSNVYHKLTRSRQQLMVKWMKLMIVALPFGPATSLGTPGAPGPQVGLPEALDGGEVSVMLGK